MGYIGTSINDSPTIVGKATQTIIAGSFLAASFDAAGGIVVAGAGKNAIGLLLPETNDVAAGADVAVQIKDIGLWKTGAAVETGAELTSDASGKCVTAVAGNFVTAIALETANAAEQVIQVQLCKSGYKPAASSGN